MGDLPFLEPPIERSTDSLPVLKSSAAMIDLEQVDEHISNAMTRGRYAGSTDPMTYLHERRCVVTVNGQTYATLAGLLCFGHNPQTLFPNAVVDIGHYRSIHTLSTEVINLERVGGTIFNQIAQVERYLWNNTRHGMTLTNGSMQRVELHEYPQAVNRELLVNTIAHRDYTQFLSNARVEMYQNRIEWISPGGLPPGITVDNILDAQVGRNPVILNVLYEAGFVEAFGQGLNTVVEVLRQEQMATPRFRDTGVSFIVTVLGRPLDVLHRFTGVPMNDAQRMILSILQVQGPLAPRSIRPYFPDRSDSSFYRDLDGLVENKLIVPIGKTRSKRYRIADSDPSP
jgi:predicted HTH transcriptional regulator